MALLTLLSLLIPLSSGIKFETRGHQIFMKDGSDTSTPILFNGIGMTCTEYMLKPEMDSKNPYPGYWAYNSCFGGPASNGGAVELNKEPDNILNYLGNNYIRNPLIKKISFESPFDQVINTTQSQHFPIVRIPMAGSSYLYKEDCDTGNPQAYQDVIDALVKKFTSNNIAVVLDLHWNCPDTTALSGCTVAQAASMALKNFGPYPGAIHLWDVISSKYANNSLVFYELFNEPWIQQFNPWYYGDNTYAGMKEMYNAVRKNDPDGIIIIGGANQYALDAQTPLGFYLQYKNDTGSYPTNVIYNIHPYQGGGQGYEHSQQAVMRLSLALKLVGPVIFTEFGQYCCNPDNNKECTGSQGQCSHPTTGNWFVYNMVNYAAQYDISWIGWAWRGTNDDYPCGSKPDCNQPDMRDENGELVDGSYGGADWKTIWSSKVATQTISIEDSSNGKSLLETDTQGKGYLVRPCIVGDANLGGICGFDLNTDVSKLSVDYLVSETIYDSILPGLPPKGNCKAQGCVSANFQCQTYTGPCSSN